LHKDCFASLALDQVRGLDARWIDITDYDLRAVVRKAKRCSPTNPGAAACNERNLASEIQFIFVRCHSSLLYWLRRMPGFCVFNYLLFLSALLEGLVDHFGKRKARSP
jgi:hypothetical protein